MLPWFSGCHVLFKLGSRLSWIARRSYIALSIGKCNALNIVVKNSVKEKFNITFMKNKESWQNINIFFPFSIKTFFNWILNQCPNDTH